MSTLCHRTLFHILSADNQMSSLQTGAFFPHEIPPGTFKSGTVVDGSMLHLRAATWLCTHRACHPLHHTWIRLSGPQHCCLHTWPVTPYTTHGYDCQGLSTAVYTHGLSPLTSRTDTTVTGDVSALSLYLMFRCPVGLQVISTAVDTVSCWFTGDFNSS